MVIAIIALLLAIVAPALRKAKDQAKMLICKTHQRSIVQAVAAYGPSNNGKLPPTTQGQNTGWMTIPMRLKYYYGTNRALNGGSVLDVLGDYMKSPEYFDCPMAKHDVAWQQEYIFAAQDTTVQFLNCSYYMLWNWTKFETSRPSFKPTDAGGDGLMTFDVLYYNESYQNSQYNGTLWVSSHRWPGADNLTMVDAMIGGTLNEGFTLWMKDDPTGKDKPRMKLNAGYKDCHVETINMDDVEPMGGVYWMPANRR